MEWLLEPGVTYLDHGAHGACTRPVFEAYQDWQRELERRPAAFLGRRLEGLLAGVRGVLGPLVGADPGELALVPNATTGLNAVIRSLRLEPGDEVLTTAHEYGALLKTWQFVGARTVAVEPERLASSIGPQTRVLFLSHVASPTARLLPVEEACRAAREAGVLSIVDGAHGPGQVEVDLEALGADVYSGNCHKWLGAPKGSAFLWSRAEHHDWIDPVVTSWGWGTGGSFAEKHEWQGTFDPAAWLTVPTAIDVWRTLDIAACRALARGGQESLPPIEGVPAPQMWATELPPGDAPALRLALAERGIEAPVQEWQGRRLLRISIAPYNTEADLERLAGALRDLGVSGSSTPVSSDRPTSRR
jgi:isopenicillin-N epimerase